MENVLGKIVRRRRRMHDVAEKDSEGVDSKLAIDSSAFGWLFVKMSRFQRGDLSDKHPETQIRTIRSNQK